MQENKREKAVFGGGCFWCTEAIFKNLKGVEKVMPGYMGGFLPNPTYEEVSRGNSGHAEVIYIEYNPAEISYEKLLEVFFATHDPTQLHRQGNDIGPQYRSTIFWNTPEQLQQAVDYILQLEQTGIYNQPIVTSLERMTDFYPAEDYHKNYLERNPDNPYCRAVILPKVEKFKSRFENLLKKN